MAEILFTRNDKCGSRLIRKVTGEDVSHVALRIGAFVIHSKLVNGGVTIDLYSQFNRDNEIPYRLPWVLSSRNLDRKNYAGRYYDVGAILYLGLRRLLPWLPKVNLWQSTGMYMCTEFVTDVIDGSEDSMITPYQLYIKLRRSKLQ